MNKNPMVAFLLGFIPGFSHFYLNKVFRGLFYTGAFFGTVMLFFIAVINGAHPGVALIIFLLGVAIWVINMIDTVYLIMNRPTQYPGYPPDQYPGYPPENMAYSDNFDINSGTYRMTDSERFSTLLFSFIPGLGHFRLGLMQRGLGFVVSFFGLGIMVFFIAALTSRSEFLVFLGIMPIIWLYCLFDCMILLNRKEKGEPLIDRTVFDDFQKSSDLGRKNKTLATMLAVFPGAGHMYLGLQQRGLQLMAVFLFSIYIMDIMRLGLFLFLIPIIWFYSFFDALQQISKYGVEPLNDVPVVKWFIHHQRWLGYGLLLLGLYYLFDQVGVRLLDRLFPEQQIMYLLDRYLPTFVVSILFIGGGLRLIFGGQGRKGIK